MDPLTILGAVVGAGQLVQQSFIIIKFLSDLCSDLADAPEKIRQHGEQIKQLLDLFHLFLQTPSLQKDSIAALLTTCVQRAARFQKRLIKLIVSDGENRAIKWKKSFQFVMADKKLALILTELERDKSSLILGIQQIDR
jgi:hypothetical protein